MIDPSQTGPVDRQDCSVCVCASLSVCVGVGVGVHAYIMYE